MEDKKIIILHNISIDIHTIGTILLKNLLELTMIMKTKDIKDGSTQEITLKSEMLEEEGFAKNFVITFTVGEEEVCKFIGNLGEVFFTKNFADKIKEGNEDFLEVVSIISDSMKTKIIQKYSRYGV